MEYILITGISTGIGHDATRFLIDKGYHVFGSVRKKEDAQRLSIEFPDRFTPLIFDVTNKSSISEAFIIVKNLLGKHSLSCLINNAGVAIPGPQLHLADDQFRMQLEVNVFGVRNVTNIFAPLLGASKNFNGKAGKIINISSISGMFNAPFNGSYCVSKHALESLSEVYRRELLFYGIDVICLNPGPILSKIWDKNTGKFDDYINTDYGKMLSKADAIIQHAKDGALPLTATSKVIYKLIQSKNPPLNTIVHKNKFAFLVQKYFPKRMMDKMIKKKLMDPNNTNYR